jgi:hypothetical protein
LFPADLAQQGETAQRTADNAIADAVKGAA